MSVWAGIKKALNSTLGTSEFKPLDELFNMHCGIYATNDYTLKELWRGGSLEEGESVGSAKINATGQINVYFSTLVSSNHYNILINGKVVASVSGLDISTYKPNSVSVEVKYGDVIEIVSASKGNGSTTIALCGLTYFAPTGGIVSNV